MYDLKKADAIYEEMREDGKDIVHEVMLVFKDKMPKEYCMLMHLIKYGCHIYDEEMYYAVDYGMEDFEKKMSSVLQAPVDIHRENFCK